MTVYAGPRRRTGKGRGPEGSGLYPELAAFRISEGCSPNVQAETGRLVGLLPIATAQAELSRHGLDLDEKAVHRIASELGLQMLATRTRDVLRYRQGELPAGTELAGKRVAVQIDGGRIRIRTVVKKSRVGKKTKRRKFRVEWREPKVLVIHEFDEKGRMVRGSRPVIDGTLRGPDALIELVAFHLHRLGAAQAQEVVFVADGAAWIWNRIGWVVQKVGLARERVFEVLDWCHAVHHVSVALEDLKLDKAQRSALYVRLRKALIRGKANEVIAELERLARARRRDQPVWREIRYLRKHAKADRMRYPIFRYRRLPIGSGAVESTIRRIINLRLKGNAIYWKADNAEAIFQLRAAELSGRLNEAIDHTRDSIARNRRLDWHWQPPADLLELKTLDDLDDEKTEPNSVQQPTRRAA